MTLGDSLLLRRPSVPSWRSVVVTIRSIRERHLSLFGSKRLSFRKVRALARLAAALERVSCNWRPTLAEPRAIGRLQP